MSLLPIPGQMVDPFANDPVVMAAIVPLRFWVKYKPVIERVEIGGKIIDKDTGQLKAEEWVEWHKKLTGSQTIAVTCVNSVDRIRKGAARATDPQDETAAIWRVMKPYYDNWKAGGTEDVTTGTPLAVWPGVPRDVVELLKPFRILSVEDLSMAGDQLLQKLPNPHMYMYRDRAKKFLSTKDIAEAVRDLDQTAAENAALKEQLAALQKAQADSAAALREMREQMEEASPMAKVKGRKREAA